MPIWLVTKHGRHPSLALGRQVAGRDLVFKFAEVNAEVRLGIECSAPLGWQTLADRFAADADALGAPTIIFDLWDRAPPANALPALVEQIRHAGQRRRMRLALNRPDIAPADLANLLAEEAHRRTRTASGKFVLERFDEIQPGETDWLVKGVMPAEGYGFLVGPSGTLKTFLALEWALSLAIGRPLFDKRTAHAGAIYVASEAPDVAAARADAEELAFHADRLETALEALGEHANQVEQREQAQAAAEAYRKAKTTRDALVAEIGEKYPKWLTEMTDLFARIIQNDADCTTANQNLAGAEWLASAEAQARGCHGHFEWPIDKGAGHTARLINIQLPIFDRSGRAWPIRTP